MSKKAEELGFDALWVHDYIVWTRELDRTHVSCGSLEQVETAAAEAAYAPNFYESITSLAYVAGITKRIKLGIAVLCLPFRNPVVTAKQIATLDVLSAGRLILGIGVGAPRHTLNRDFEVLGVPRSDKYRRTTEYLRAMQTIWTEPYPSFEGQFVSFEPTELNPKPVQKPYPPIWMGGRGDKAIEMAAEFATGWLPGGLSPEQYPEHISRLRETARAKGRGDVAFDIGLEVAACVADTQRAAREKSRHTLEAFPQAYSAYGSMDIVLASSLIGSVEEVRDKVGRLVSAGVSHFEIKFIYRGIDDLYDQMEVLSREIAPSVRTSPAPVA